ncbi:hypothetical protein MSAN_00038600 [Mycena sanguinolenta]|uniref:Uncharacterized protein n=1 Tax=Mycena sanguinolenta TaxID=230812 RepID=A0A8H6ZF65_9AGAR|nr:hypothetical protein MSAN_00038600 [Mycena sanguinolenta]
MLSLRLNHLAFFFCLFLALSPTNAVPVVIKRQSDGQSTTVMTQSTTSTPVGDMTQTCVITLTPITVNGQQEIQEVKTCTLSMAAQNNSGSTGGDNGGNSTTTGGGSTSGGDTTSSSGDSSTSTDSSNSGSTSTDTSGTAASTDAGSPVSVNGLSSVAPASVTGSATDSTGASATDSTGASASATATDSAAAGTSTTAAPTNGAVSAGSVVMVPASAQNTAITAATQAADQAASASASAAFTVPGQKIQVLPIGLGVFAGISVIALIVVGLVTYERTKYRKAFRARKLAESGAGMGYGGMAQR